MPAGRPPKILSNEEIIELGEELLKWMEDNKKNKDIVHLSQFYSEYKGICRSDWRAIVQRLEFLTYYEKALEWMGTKTLTNDRVPSSYGNRFLNIYFKDVREMEREVNKEKVEDEVAIKKAELSTVTQEAIEMNRQVVESITKLQELKKNQH